MRVQTLSGTCFVPLTYVTPSVVISTCNLPAHGPSFRPPLAPSVRTQARGFLPSMSSSSSSITPTTRSRTLLFLSYRDSRGPTSASRKRAQSSRNNYYDSTESGQGEEDERLLIGSANGEHVALDVDRDALPPPWVDVSDRVDELLAGIQTKSA